MSIGPKNTVGDIVGASLAVGFECMTTISLFNVFLGPLRGGNTIVLYAAVGAASGLTWWTMFSPPYPWIVAVGTGALLAGLWAFTEESFAGGNAG